MNREARIGFERLDAEGIQRTPQGGIRVPARFTRVGVFVYRDASGREVRELRPPEEVFDAASLATLRDAPVTVLHPKGLVTPETYRRDGVGHVSGEARTEADRYVAGVVVVQDADAVRRVDARELREISMGYTAEIDWTPGEWRGERYDAVQRRIRYNHAALGPSGWGRAGAEVALRLDAGDAAVEVRTDHDDEPAPPRRERRNDTMQTIRIDGVPYEVGSDAMVEAVRALEERTRARIDTLEANVAEACRRADEATGRADTLSTELETARAELAEATSPARLDALAAERAAFITAARTLLGADARLDGMTDRQIRIQAIARRQPRVDAAALETESDDAIRARFDTLVAIAGGDRETPAGPGPRVHVDASGNGAPPTDPVSRLDAVIAANAEFASKRRERFALSK